MEYDPYLALWPGVSDLPSSPLTRPCYFSSSLLSRSNWSFSQVTWMAGWRYSFWCLKNVFLLIVAQFRVLNILSALAGKEPLYRIAADVRIFPAGMFCMCGWLSQTYLLLHRLHSCLMRRKDPITCRVLDTRALPQCKQQHDGRLKH